MLILFLLSEMLTHILKISCSGWFPNKFLSMYGLVSPIKDFSFVFKGQCFPLKKNWA